MKAHEFMVKEVYKVKASDTVRAAVEKLIEYGIGGLPVVNDRNEVVGYLSDGDIMRFIGKHDDVIVDVVYFSAVFKGDDVEYEARAKELLGLNVMEIAQKKVMKAAWDDEVEVVAATLGKKKIKKLPVERNGVLVGIISRGNVIRETFKSML